MAHPVHQMYILSLISFLFFSMRSLFLHVACVIIEGKHNISAVQTDGFRNIAVRGDTMLHVLASLTGIVFFFLLEISWLFLKSQHFRSLCVRIERL